MAVVVRRGIYLDLDKTKLLPGELCITTDTGQCFFCYAPGNVKELATKKDLQEILTESPEAYNALQKLLEDLENNKDELTNILNDILSLKENKLDVTGDSCNNTVTFEEANNDEDIVSGETHAKIFGKILKSFKALRQGKINTTNIVQTDAVNEQTKVPSSAVTYAHGQLISQLQSNITALNNKLAGKLLGNLTARFAIYDSLPTDDTPNGWITAYGRNAIIISDITNYNGYYGLMLTIIGSIDTEYVGQIIITGTGIKSRRSSSLSNWSNWV